MALKKRLRNSCLVYLDFLFCLHRSVHVDLPQPCASKSSLPNLLAMESKVVLITGASSGIGAHAAEHLASVGYRKLALVARRRQQLEEVAQRCKAKGAQDVLVVDKDVTKDGQCTSIIEAVVQHFGGSRK